MIPYGKQQITSDDINAVVDTLKSDFLTQGSKVTEFEDSFSQFVDSKYSVAVSNGTAALHLAMMALGIGKGDLVVTTPITFVASSNAALYVDAEVQFCDIDESNYLIDLDKLEKLCKIENIKAVVIVDFAGYPADGKRLRSLANEYNFKIIEDACHAPGARFYDGNDWIKVGSGKYSDITVFSFHPVKHIACGEGGMITTQSKSLYDKCMLLRAHGIVKNDQLTKENGGWYYEMQELGYNYRLSDIHCALGLSQLKRMDLNLKRRNEISEFYRKEIIKSDYLVIKDTPATIEHAYHLFIVEVENRTDLYEYLKKNNIFSQVLYIPIHYQPYYQNLGFKKGQFPVSEKYYEKALALPMYHSLSSNELEYVVEKVNEWIEAQK